MEKVKVILERSAQTLRHAAALDECGQLSTRQRVEALLVADTASTVLTMLNLGIPEAAEYCLRTLDEYSTRYLDRYCAVAQN